ncbi:hypothetical protein ACS0TY_015253 [Phlomoides rotata]
MATVVRVVVLLWVDILAMYAMYVMMEYLTNVWKLGFTHAAAIVNIFWGVVSVSPLLLAYIVDTIMGCYWMLLLSSVSFSVGLGLLTMSTPPVLAHAMGTCREYKPECIGEGQRILFYIALPLIGFGMSGHAVSWTVFMNQQISEEDDESRTFWKFSGSILVTIIFNSIASFALPYVKPWSLRFGIPAICNLVAALLFFSGSCSYTYIRPAGIPLTAYIRVFVAAVSNLFYTTPEDAKELYEIQDYRFYKVPHTRSLRFLDKAAIVKPTEPLEEQEKNLWRLCTVTEVEETKTIIHMIPVWMTFIICGVVRAIGITFFIEQLDNLNHKVILLIFQQAQCQSVKLYDKFANYLSKSVSRNFLLSFGIIVSMILAILCCITAAIVEDRRLGVVKKHGLVGKQDERVAMSMFWLLPQFILLGAFNGIFSFSATCFFIDQSPQSTQTYLPFFTNVVLGVGVLCSVLSVFVVGKVSESGGGTNRFQHDLNASRVDKYYWTLACLMTIDLVIFIVVAMFY